MYTKLLKLCFQKDCTIEFAYNNFWL